MFVLSGTISWNSNVWPIIGSEYCVYENTGDKGLAARMELAIALILMVLLILASTCGLFVQKKLKEHHRSHENSEAVRLIALMLVTLAALILGLLVTSVKADFDSHDDLYRQYGIALIRMDIRLRELGPQTAPIRKTLRAYTAMVIWQAWPDEPAPDGVYPTRFSPLYPGSDETLQISMALRSIDEAIQNLKPATPYQQNVYPILRKYLADMEAIRWTLVEGASSRVSGVFLCALMFWLIIVFFMFGIVAPKNSLIYLTLFLSSLSVASTLFVVLDLDNAMAGFIRISSQPMRDALVHMDQPLYP